MLQFIRLSVVKLLTYSGTDRCDLYAATFRIAEWFKRQKRSQLTEYLDENNLVPLAKRLALPHEQNIFDTWLTGEKARERALFILLHVGRLVAHATIGEIAELFKLETKKSELDLSAKIQCLSFTFCRSEVQRRLIETSPCDLGCRQSLYDSIHSFDPQFAGLSDFRNNIDTLPQESINSLRCLFGTLNFLKPRGITIHPHVYYSILTFQLSVFLFFLYEVFYSVSADLSHLHFTNYQPSKFQSSPSPQQRLFLWHYIGTAPDANASYFAEFVTRSDTDLNSFIAKESSKCTDLKFFSLGIYVPNELLPLLSVISEDHCSMNNNLLVDLQLTRSQFYSQEVLKGVEPDFSREVGDIETIDHWLRLQQQSLGRILFDQETNAMIYQLFQDESYLIQHEKQMMFYSIVKLAETEASVEFKVKEIAEELLLCHTLDHIPVKSLYPNVFLDITQRAFFFRTIARLLKAPQINQCDYYAMALNIARWYQKHSIEYQPQLFNAVQSVDKMFFLMALQIAQIPSNRYEPFLFTWLTQESAIERAKFFLLYLDRFVAKATFGQLVKLFGIDIDGTSLDLERQIVCLNFAYCRSEVLHALHLLRVNQANTAETLRSRVVTKWPIKEERIETLPVASLLSIVSLQHSLSFWAPLRTVPMAPEVPMFNFLTEVLSTLAVHAETFLVALDDASSGFSYTDPLAAPSDYHRRLLWSLVVREAENPKKFLLFLETNPLPLRDGDVDGFVKKLKEGKSVEHYLFAEEICVSNELLLFIKRLGTPIGKSHWQNRLDKVVKRLNELLEEDESDPVDFEFIESVIPEQKQNLIHWLSAEESNLRRILTLSIKDTE